MDNLCTFAPLSLQLSNIPCKTAQLSLFLSLDCHRYTIANLSFCGFYCHTNRSNIIISDHPTPNFSDRSNIINSDHPTPNFSDNYVLYKHTCEVETRRGFGTLVLSLRQVPPDRRLYYIPSEGCETLPY